MNKFFTIKKKKKAITKKAPAKMGCEKCGLYKICNSPKMEVIGKGHEKILIVGNMPSEKEDKTGEQMTGEVAQFVKRLFDSHDIDFDEDCWKTNAVRCRPKKNITNTHINCCRKKLFETVQELKPEKVFLFGAEALQSYFGVTGITKWTGAAVPDYKNQCWVFPMYHPMALFKQSKNIPLKNIFHKDFKKAIKFDKELPVNDFESRVQIIKDVDKATRILKRIKSSDEFVFDYETTGKKPYKTGHEILCMSIALSEKRVYAFPFFDDPFFAAQLRRIFLDKTIKKIAHNLKFEDTWTNIIFKCMINGWHWDTMIVQHILDARTGITGLKHQSAVRYGVFNYSESVDLYIKSTDKSANAFNDMKNCPLDDMLLYCGLDSLFEYKLYQDQKKELKGSQLVAYTLFHEGSIELAGVERNGIQVNSNYFQQANKILTKKAKKAQKIIDESKESILWKKKENKSLDINSPTQLKKLFFDYLNYAVIKKTAKGNASVDAEALESIGTSFTENILKLRKIEKLQGTYLAGFIREDFNHEIHASFNLNMARTFRSSSSNPNFQNVPKHDLYAQKICRSGIIPSPGNQLMEVDYSGVEVTIGACIHKDPNMIKYIQDETTDMHRDTAKELFLMNEVSKDQRYLAKNNFVFAEFYGDYYGNCARNLWEKIDDEIISNLKKHKIKTYQSFENHVKKIESNFWNKRFKVYNKWKINTWIEFQKKGYIYTPTNFKIEGDLDKKNVCNYPIQGSAFHCLLWSLIYINKFLKKEKFNTKIVGQIHDSIIFDMVPEEKEILKPIIRHFMTEKIREYWDWIILPLDIDAEISDINGNWFKMHDEEI